MKSLFYIVTILIAISILFVSCKKKEPPPPTKTELITAKSWKLSACTSSPAFRINGFPYPISDIYPFMEECMKDNFTTYYTNGNLTEDEGSLKCDSAAQQTIDGKWSFNSDETKITFTNFNGYSGTIIFDIVEISTDKLSYRYTINNMSDLATITDTTGISSYITIQPGTKVTTNFSPK